MGQSSSSSRPPRVLVLGLDGAGKTCLLRRLARQEIALTAPTHGFQIVRVEFDGVPVELIDVGGREELRAHWHTYFRGLAGLVFVLDASDKRRLEEAGTELNKLLREPELAHVPTLIAANKHDILDALPAQKVRARGETAGGLGWARARGEGNAADLAVKLAADAQRSHSHGRCASEAARRERASRLGIALAHHLSDRLPSARVASAPIVSYTPHPP